MAAVNLGDDIEYLNYYCSSSTFLSIIKNRSFWLTALSLSNDVKEGRWAIDKYLQLFNLTDRPQRRAAEVMLGEALNSRLALGMCFSAEHDLLSQWRGYASGGRGLCISFDIRYIQAMVERLRQSYRHFELARVTYDSVLDPALVQLIRSEYGAQMDEARNAESNSLLSLKKEYGPGAHDRETSLASQLYQVKNPAFGEEKEYRLLLVDYPSRIAGVKYRETNGLISPYVEIDADLDAISSVTLGPVHPTPRRDVEGFLKSAGIRCPVVASSASYVLR